MVIFDHGKTKIPSQGTAPVIDSMTICEKYYFTAEYLYSIDKWNQIVSSGTVFSREEYLLKMRECRQEFKEEDPSAVSIWRFKSRQHLKPQQPSIAGAIIEQLRKKNTQSVTTTY